MEKRSLDCDLVSAGKKQKTSQNENEASKRPAVSLSALPPEILAKVIENLDTNTLFNLHQADVMPLKGLIKECSFSMNTIATAKSLKSLFFKDIAEHLKVLNLSGVSDLTWPVLKIALKMTRNLVDLDVMSTKIIMPDFIEIVNIRPSLESIAINFTFGHQRKVIGKVIIKRLQQAFQRFKKVKFLGTGYESFRLCNVGIEVLKKADLDNLTYIIDYDYNINGFSFDDEIGENSTSLKQLQVHFLPGVHKSAYIILTLLDLNDYEIVILETSKNVTRVIATRFLKNIIRERSPVDVESLSNSDNPSPSMSEFKDKLELLFESIDSKYGLTVMFWNRKSVGFDEKFNSTLLRYLKDYLVFKIRLPLLAPLPKDYKWHTVHISTSDTNQQTKSIEIDYGNIFKEKEDVKLNIILDKDLYNYTIMPMINKCDFMKKISHLYLCNYGNRYDTSFFKHLFEQCCSLITLQINDIEDTTSLQPLHISKSLKNIYLLGISLKFLPLFIYLSECQSLENITLVHIEYLDALPDPTNLFTNCDNLYNFRVQSSWYDQKCCDYMVKYYAKVKSTLSKNSLNIDINGHCEYLYSPYVSVFNNFQLRPI